MVEMQQMVMTVERAKALLDTVTPDLQRKFRASIASRYARDLKAGKWQHQGDVFRVSDSGHLIDGQHRCSAVVQTGMPIPYPVILITGIAEEAIHTIDRNAPRKMRDVFHLKGYKGQLSKAGELARLRLELDGVKCASDEEILSMAEAHPSYSWVLTAMPNLRFLGRAPVRLALAEFFERDQIKAVVASEKLVKGDDMKRGHPILTLRNYLLAGNKSIRESHRAIYCKAVSAFYAFLNDETREKLYGIEWPK